jgi:hypothetical protein
MSDRQVAIAVAIGGIAETVNYRSAKGYSITLLVGRLSNNGPR